MSIANPIPRQTRQAILTAGASQSTFGPFDFPLFDADDVQVRVKAVGAPGYTLLSNDQYSVAAAAPAVNFPALFTVTLVTGRAAGDVVWIKGARLGSRTTNVTREGVIRSQPLENELDRQVATEQELRRDIDALIAGGAAHDLIASGVANDSTSPGGTVADSLGLLAGRVTTDEANIADLTTRIGSVEGAIAAFPTKAAVAAAVISASTSTIRTVGYFEAGDGGAALYKRVNIEPSHSGKIQSADGGWWEISERLLRPEMFGAAATDTSTANAVGQALSGAAIFTDVTIQQDFIFGRKRVRVVNTDFAAGTAGSFVDVALGAASGSTYGEIQVFNAGGNVGGPLRINQAGGNVDIGTHGFIVGITDRARVKTADFVAGAAGSFIDVSLGADTGNTYARIQAFKAGGATFGDLRINDGGGNILIGDASNTNVNLRGNLNIAPLPNSYAQGITMVQSAPESGSIAGPYVFNHVEATFHSTLTGTGDPGTVGAAWASGFQFNIGVGGPNYNTVSTFGISVGLIHTADDTCTGDKTAFSSGIYCNHSSPGRLYGGATAFTVDSGGYTPQAIGLEVDTLITGTGSVDNFIGINSWQGGTKRGNFSTAAYAISISGAPGTVTWKTGFMIYTAAGTIPAPFSNDGDLFAADRNVTLKNIFNFGNVTVTDFILSFPKTKMFDGSLLLAGGVASTSPVTGDLQLAGGAGVTGAIYGGGKIRSISKSGGVGYDTGAGAAVVQVTSRTTPVTIDAVCGSIQLFSAAGSTTPASFVVSNSVIRATDTIIINQKSGTNAYFAYTLAVSDGSFQVAFYSIAGLAVDAPVFNFAILKAVAA